jgi:hypothetical protein
LKARPLSRYVQQTVERGVTAAISSGIIAEPPPFASDGISNRRLLIGFITFFIAAVVLLVASSGLLLAIGTLLAVLGGYLLGMFRRPKGGDRDLRKLYQRGRE